MNPNTNEVKWPSVSQGGAYNLYPPNTAVLLRRHEISAQASYNRYSEHKQQQETKSQWCSNNPGKTHPQEKYLTRQVKNANKLDDYNSRI